MKIQRWTDTGEWTTRRYLALLGNILIWAIVAIDGFYLWPTQLHGSTSMVIVSGRSMEPTYFSGDLVIARKMTPSVGDVIVYAPEGFGGSQIVHRIIGGNAVDGWVMQGDNNPNADPFTPKDGEIRGVVLVHYANFGRVTVLLLNPIVWALVLLAAVVLLVWWSGDTCEDDEQDKDKDKREDGADPESEAEEEPDLIDRFVEGTEAALSRMVASGADAGAAALAMLPRPAPAPRHATSMPRHRFPHHRSPHHRSPHHRSPHHGAPAYLRGSAIIAVLALLAVFGPTPAFASSLGITTGGSIFTKTYTPCTTATLGVTYAGTANPSGSTNYPSMAITGLTGCAGLKLSYTAYGSAGQTLASGANITVVAGTNTVSPGGTYNAALVTRVSVTVNGWPLTSIWTGPLLTPPFPAAGKCDGVLIATGQLLTGNNCTLTTTSTRGTTVPANDHALLVESSTRFATNNSNTQNLTTWRYTLNLTTLPNSWWIGSLSGGYYIYTYGNDNIVTAPGETCLNPASVTFQEANPSGDGTSSFVLSTTPQPGWDPWQICPVP